MDVALVGLVDARGWVLLQERDENAPTDPDRWSLVGGAVEAGETPAVAARRELREETELVHDDLRPLGSFDLPCKLHGEDTFSLFAGSTEATDADVTCHEGRQIVFVDPVVALSLDLTAATRRLLPVVTSAAELSLPSELQIRQVDERDSGWEDHGPRFRVYLHDSDGSTTPGSTDTYDITGADVLQVIDWAQRRAGDSLTWAVALVRDDASGRRGLVWLVGVDGNDRESGIGGSVSQRRMLARRGDPVRLPPADRMPPDRHDVRRGVAGT